MYLIVFKEKISKNTAKRIYTYRSKRIQTYLAILKYAYLIDITIKINPQ